MPPIIVAALLAGVAYVVTKLSPAEPAPSSGGPVDPVGSAGDIEDRIRQIAPEVPGALLAAGGTASTVIGSGSIAGAGFTSAVGGSAAAGAIAVTGAALVAAEMALLGHTGSNVGGDIDRALGGTGGGTTGTTARIVTASAFASAPLGGAGTLGIGILGFGIYAIMSAIEDGKLLAKGQAGAEVEYWQKWHETESVAFHAFKSLNLVRTDGVTPLSDNEIVLRSWAFADGYMQEVNRLKYVQWYRRPWGFGQNFEGHMLWGWERGHWFGSVLGGPERPNEGPELASTLDFDTQTPHQTYESVFNAPDVEANNIDERYFIRNDLVMPALPPDPSDQDRARWLMGYGGVLTPVYGWRKERLFWRGERDWMRNLGRVRANVDQYTAWMNEPRGLGQSSGSHFEWGKNAGYFSGEHAGEGRLHIDGVTYDSQGNQWGEMPPVPKPPTPEQVQQAVANATIVITPEQQAAFAAMPEGDEKQIARARMLGF